MTKEILSKAEDSDTYATKVERATLYETAYKDAARFEPATTVHAVKSRRPGDSAQTQRSERTRSWTAASTNAEKCFRCDKPGHKAADCYFKQTECRYCKIVGHIERACKKKKARA
eukprot:scpid60959/ scgid19069/ 